MRKLEVRLFLYKLNKKFIKLFVLYIYVLNVGEVRPLRPGDKSLLSENSCYTQQLSPSMPDFLSQYTWSVQYDPKTEIGLIFVYDSVLNWSTPW